MSNVLEKKEKGLSGVISEFFDNDRFFEGFPMNYFKGRFPSIRSDAWEFPAVNITEDSGNFRFEVPAPGFEKEHFRVNVENGVLSLSARKEEEKKEEKQNYLRKEFSYNSFSRSFRLPENSDPEKLEAKFENGMLKLTLPKREQTIQRPGKEIKVQ